MHTRVAARIVKASDLRPGDKFGPFPKRGHTERSREEWLANPILSLGVVTEGWMNSWTRTDTPCPDALAEEWVFRYTEEEVA